MNGPGVQSQNFGIDGGNVRDRMHSPKLCKKLIFGSLDSRVMTRFFGSRPSSTIGQPHEYNTAGRACSQHDTPTSRAWGVRHALPHDATRRSRAQEDLGA